MTFEILLQIVLLNLHVEVVYFEQYIWFIINLHTYIHTYIQIYIATSLENISEQTNLDFFISEFKFWLMCFKIYFEKPQWLTWLQKKFHFKTPLLKINMNSELPRPFSISLGCSRTILWWIPQIQTIQTIMSFNISIWTLM